MIQRKRGSNPNLNQLIDEDSFTNKKGIDVTQAPPMRDFILDANNVDINLDGSLSLRKPLIATAITTEGYILTKELYTTPDYVQFTSSTITIKPDNNTVLAKYVKNGTEYTTSIAGLDFTKVEVTNTATSTIISNVLIDLTVFAGGDLDVANLSTHSVYGSFRLVKDAQTSEWILEYTIPYVANLLRTDSSSEFNPNTAGYYTYALRDTYNSPYYSVQGILAYTEGEQGSTTVADLTETDKYKHFIVNSTKDSIPVILKAFCTFNKNNITNNIYYGCWECSVDGVTYIEVPEFIEQWENSPLMTTVKVVNNMLSKSTLDDPDDIVYDYKRVVSLANINSEEDLMSTRPDILKVNSISGATYRFTIYYTLAEHSKSIASRSITKLSNKTVSYSTLDDIYRLEKTSDFTSEDFNVTYTVDDDFSLSNVTGRILFKNTYDSDVTKITLSFTTLDLHNNILTITASPTSSIQSLTGKDQLYNIKSVEIILLYGDGSVFDKIKYTVLDVKDRLTTPTDKYVATICSPTFEKYWGYNQWFVAWYSAAPSISDKMEVTFTGTITDASFPDASLSTVTLAPLDFTGFHYYHALLKPVCENISDLGSDYTIIADTLDCMNPGIFKFHLYADDLVDTSKMNVYEVNDIVQGQSNFQPFSDWLGLLANYVNATYNGNNYTYLGDVPNATLTYTYNPYYIGANGKFLEKATAWSNEQELLNSINADSRYYDETHPDVNMYNDPVSIHKQAYSLSFSLYTHTYGDTLEVLNKDMVNTNKGKKLYYKYRLYSYGEAEFKNCIYVSDSNSFITSLLNTIDLPISQDSNITALTPWREYLIASNETNIFLITPTGDGFTSKVINTFIGIPKKDSETLKSILNGVIFKSGSKIYSLQPSLYSSNDNVLNIIDISKPVAPYIVDTEYDNFAFTTEQHYYLCIPSENTTTVLKYEYSTRIWTKHTYYDRFISAYVNTVDDIRIIGAKCVYLFNHDKDIVSEFLDVSCSAQYGDLELRDGYYFPVPFDFLVDTGQKSYSMNNIKQFVESKLIFALLDSSDSIPLNVDIYVDNYKQILHMDCSSSSAYWRDVNTMLVLSSDVPMPATASNPVIKQLFLRYSGKGNTIRHVVSGKSHSNFKFYVSYYRYKSTINKH